MNPRSGDHQRGERARGPRRFPRVPCGAPQLAADSQAMLARESVSRLLTFGGEPFTRYLRPHMVTPGQYEVITDVVRTLASAMVKLRRACLADTNSRDQLDLNPEELRLAMIDPGFEEPSPSIRARLLRSERDGVCGDQRGSPAAIAMRRARGPLFGAARAARVEASERLPSSPLYAAPLMQRYARHGRSFADLGPGFNDTPTVAIVDWAAAYRYRVRDSAVLRGAWLRRSSLSRSDWSSADGGCGTRLCNRHLLQARITTSCLLTRRWPAPRYSLRGGHDLCVNSFRAKFLHKKMSLA